MRILIGLHDEGVDFEGGLVVLDKVFELRSCFLLLDEACDQLGVRAKAVHSEVSVSSPAIQ